MLLIYKIIVILYQQTTQPTLNIAIKTWWAFLGNKNNPMNIHNIKPCNNKKYNKCKTLANNVMMITKHQQYIEH